MTFLPIVERELRVAARARGTYRARLGAALAALLVGGWIMLMPWLRQPQVLGMALFVSLSIIAFLFSLLAGVFATADCLSEEKRDGTLGLLFLTDLRGFDIVFGKLAATSLNTFYGMLAIFPVMAISLLAGGVTGAEFGRVVLVCVNNLFFSLAVGMFCSAISRDERKAMGAAVLIILLLGVVFPVAGLIVFGETRPAFFCPPLFLFSPGYGCFMAFDETFKAFAKFNLFYQSLGCIHALGWALLAAACVIVPRTWHDTDASPATNRRREFWRRLGGGSREARRALRTRLLEINPFLWLTGRDRTKALYVWAFLGVGALMWAFGLWKYPRDWKDGGAYVWTALIAHTVLKLWVVSEACRHFAADRRSGALELLLCTPLPVATIVRGQVLALARQFSGPVLVVLVADAVFALTQRHDAEWILVWIAGLSVFAADIVALSWLGMWLGLRSRSSTRAIGGAVARVMVLPWVVYGIGMTLLSVTALRSRMAREWFNETTITGLWMVLSLVTALGFGIWARRRLLTDFRAVATQRYEARGGRKRWWRKEGS